MPQIDLESPVTGGINDRKIARESQNPPENDVIAGENQAESFWLSKDAEYDWFDHAAFVERKEFSPTVGNSSNSNQQQVLNPRSNSISHNLKSKAFVIGLFKAPKTTTMVDAKRRTCKPGSIRLFPKRAESGGKPAVPVAEPGSPKVSCMGRVRSKRGLRRRERGEEPVEKSRTGGVKEKTGFYFRFISWFGFGKGQKKLDRSRSRKVAEAIEEESVFVEPRRKSVSVKLREISISDEPVVEPPSLGGMKVFASGRRSGAWTDDEFSLGELDRRVSFGV